MASNAIVASIAIIVYCVFDRCHPQSCHLGLGGRRAAKLACTRSRMRTFNVAMGMLLAANRNVAGDAVKVMRLLLPAIFGRYL